MDRIQQRNYEKDFTIAFLKAKGDAFQGFFEKLMLKAHPNDFLACRPWGNVGDRKNDGYLPSERILFQCYAPNEIRAADAIKKIKEDFEGAKKYWGKDFDEWTFVHNAPDGRLGPHIIEALTKLRQDNPKIKIGNFGYEEMLAKFRKLSLQDLDSWFGPSLTMEAFAQDYIKQHAKLLSWLDNADEDLATEIDARDYNTLCEFLKARGQAELICYDPETRTALEDLHATILSVWRVISDEHYILSGWRMKFNNRERMDVNVQAILREKKAEISPLLAKMKTALHVFSAISRR